MMQSEMIHTDRVLIVEGKYDAVRLAHLTDAMILLTDWRVFLVVAAVFFILFFIWRYVSLSSVSAAVAYPIATFVITYLFDYHNSPVPFHGDKPLTYVAVATVVALLMGGIVVYKHKENIARLRAGTEKKIIF